MRLVLLLDRKEDYQMYFIHFQTLFFLELVNSSPDIRYEMLVEPVVKMYCISVLFSTPLVQEDVFLNDVNTTAWVLTFLFQCKYIEEPLFKMKSINPNFIFQSGTIASASTHILEIFNIKGMLERSGY